MSRPIEMLLLGVVTLLLMTSASAYQRRAFARHRTDQSRKQVVDLDAINNVKAEFVASTPACPDKLRHFGAVQFNNEIFIGCQSPTADVTAAPRIVVYDSTGVTVNATAKREIPLSAIPSTGPAQFTKLRSSVKNSRLYVGLNQGGLQIWAVNPTDGQVVKVVDGLPAESRFSLSQDGKVVAGNGSDVLVYDVSAGSGKLESTIKTSVEALPGVTPIGDVVKMANGNFLLVASEARFIGVLVVGTEGNILGTYGQLRADAIFFPSGVELLSDQYAAVSYWVNEEPRITVLTADLRRANAVLYGGKQDGKWAIHSYDSASGVLLVDQLKDGQSASVYKVSLAKY